MGHAPQAFCIGEAMALLVPEQAGPLEDVTMFQHSYGGAEANVARGPAALGFPNAWVSRVGADGFGTDDPLRLRALLPGPHTLVAKDTTHTATAVTADGHCGELLGCSPAAWAATRVTASGVTSL